MVRPASFVLAFFALVVSVSARDYYELRTYRLKSPEKAALFDESFGAPLVRKLAAAGAGPVGVFKAREEKGGGEVLRHVLIPCKDIATWAGLGVPVVEDKAAEAFLSAPFKDPAYSRVESSLFIAFEGMPELKLPAAPVDKAGRHFELRIYESHNVEKAALKVEMFNKAELEIFRKTGLKPVFFGQARVGGNLPNLTYMLAYDSDADREKAWGTFGKHPDWEKLKKLPRYADTVSKIDSSFLVATGYSQIQ